MQGVADSRAHLFHVPAAGGMAASSPRLMMRLRQALFVLAVFGVPFLATTDTDTLSSHYAYHHRIPLPALGAAAAPQFCELRRIQTGSTPVPR